MSPSWVRAYWSCVCFARPLPGLALVLSGGTECLTEKIEVVVVIKDFYS